MLKKGDTVLKFGDILDREWLKGAALDISKFEPRSLRRLGALRLVLFLLGGAVSI
jgi:hypothetical protein